MRCWGAENAFLLAGNIRNWTQTKLPNFISGDQLLNYTQNCQASLDRCGTTRSYCFGNAWDPSGVGPGGCDGYGWRSPFVGHGRERGRRSGDLRSSRERSWCQGSNKSSGIPVVSTVRRLRESRLVDSAAAETLPMPALCLTQCLRRSRPGGSDYSSSFRYGFRGIFMSGNLQNLGAA